MDHGLGGLHAISPGAVSENPHRVPGLVDAQRANGHVSARRDETQQISLGASLSGQTLSFPNNARFV
jgi:hypothetical protein